MPGAWRPPLSGNLSQMLGGLHVYTDTPPSTLHSTPLHSTPLPMTGGGERGAAEMAKIIKPRYA